MADILDIPAWLRGARGWQPVLAAGVAVLTAASVAVAVHAPDPASADTFVSVAREAQVYLPDGSSHPAVEGERLARGAELHTGSNGGAQLTTAGRTTYVGASSTLTVLDGVRQDLAKGLAMVDARRGARLELGTTAGTVRLAEGALVRVEESALERVAVYAGQASLQVVGRSATTEIDSLYQVRVQPGSLPQRTTPLILRLDPWDQALAAGLVSADKELTGLARGLSESAGASYLRVAPAALRVGGIPAEGTARGEEALTVALGAVARAGKAADVRAYRADNASWGVVAALVEASVDSVSSLVSAALTPADVPTSTTTVNAGGVPDLGPVPTTAPSPGARPSTPTQRPTSRPTTGTPGTPSPSADPGLVATLVDTVRDLIDPSPQPAKPVLPLPLPSPTGLLGGLLK